MSIAGSNFQFVLNTLPAVFNSSSSTLGTTLWRLFRALLVKIGFLLVMSLTFQLLC